VRSDGLEGGGGERIRTGSSKQRIIVMEGHQRVRHLPEVSLQQSGDDVHVLIIRDRVRKVDLANILVNFLLEICDQTRIS